MCEPWWSVTVIALASGTENRNLNWTQARHKYDASLAVRTSDDYVEVLNHFHQARGRTHTWPLRDPIDHRCEQASGVIRQTGDDSPQGITLYKQYGTGEFAYYRKITRPKDGTIAVYINGTPAVEDSDFELDYETGEISFTTNHDLDDLAWSGQFYVPCRYDIDKLPAQIVNREGSAGELLVSVDGLQIVEVAE